MTATHGENGAGTALRVSALSKAFSGHTVLDDVSFDLRRGEIHALVGENGCGKSTLIKCLAGYHAPSHGSIIELGGKPLPAEYSPADSLRFGFRFIHQVLGLVPTLTVLENIAITRGFTVGGLWNIDRDAERERAREALSIFDRPIDPDARVSDISQADRTLVAIARALQASDGEARVLVLDEPTAALPESDVEQLFAALRRVAASGLGIVYVSHRLGEILSLCDRVTALRDGRNAGTRSIAGATEQDLVGMIVGRSLDAFYPERPESGSAEELVRVEGLAGSRTADIDFRVGRGEIVGIAGLLGSGRSEIGRMLFGMQRPREGTIFVDGSPVAFAAPSDALKAGIGYVPEDRHGQGAIGPMSVGENMTLADISPFWSGGWLRRSRERAHAHELAETFNVRPRDIDTTFSKLSGGNQQKAIIARMMRLSPRLLIFDEPVQGIDIGSKTEIYQMIRDTASNGTAVIVIDSDFEDLCRLCHRVLVLRDGRLVTTVEGPELTRQTLLQLVYLESSTDTTERATA